VRRRRLLQIGECVGRAERETEGGGVGSGVPHGRGRRRERGGGAGLVAGPWGMNGSGRRGRRRQRALAVEAGWRTGEGGGARVSAAGCGRERGKQGRAVVGHRQVGPASTVPGGAVQTRF
jgi:hypothetical protein